MSYPWAQWVIDASVETAPGVYCFCPVEGIESADPIFYTGFNLISATVPKGGRDDRL